MTGYIRADTTDQIANGNTVDAIPLDAEFNAIQAAFASVNGHSHDGGVGEGSPITVVGPTQDVVISGISITPKTDNVVSLGTSTLEFKDLWVDGIANIDSLVADTADINGGTVDATVIGATTPAAATVTSLAASTATVGGDAVTTNTAAQTLTNKTINLASNTLVATSAQLAAAITDETGTGSVVFSASPALTGTPTAPTAPAATNTTQIATTAHVFAERSNTATLTNKTLTNPTINGGTISGITDLGIADGGTGSSTPAGALINFGLTATAAEINKLAGTPAGLTATEIGYVDGVTAPIQTQLDSKQPIDSTLTALAAYNANGILTQTAADTFTSRAITQGTGIVVTNGDGVLGNPSVSADLASLSEAQNGVDNTHLMTPLRTKQAIDALVPAPLFTASVELNLGLLSSGSALSAAHGLGSRPILTTLGLECVSADAGYAVGDRITFMQAEQANTDFNGLVIWCNNTTVGVSHDGPILVVAKGGGGTTLTPARWRAYVRAWV